MHDPSRQFCVGWHWLNSDLATHKGTKAFPSTHQVLGWLTYGQIGLSKGNDASHSAYLSIFACSDTPMLLKLVSEFTSFHGSR